MNNLDKQYIGLLKDILENGTKKETRNGGTISVFGRQIRHKMSEGYPLLTSKKMAFKTMVTELLWFLSGNTNIKYLVDNGCNIWTGDAYKSYSKEVNELIDGYMCGDIMGMQSHIEKMFSNPDDLTPLTQEEFINKIKTDDEFAKKWGDLGPIYGKQWRRWVGKSELANGSLSASTTFGYIDQLANLIHDLKTNPDSRRLMITAWNPADLSYQTLPPCHYGFQVYTRELSNKERVELSWFILNPDREEKEVPEWWNIKKLTMDESNIPTRAISLSWQQRSVDTPLGLPFNIASYALLLEIIAKMVNMVPDELIGNLGDTHIYLNQIDGVKEQITRGFFELPKLVHFKTNDYYRELSEDLSLLAHLDPEDFTLENYQSHSKIYYPLSN